MARQSNGGAASAERALIETVTASLMVGVPQGWQVIRARFEPTANLPVASVTASWPDGVEQSLRVLPEALALVGE